MLIWDFYISRGVKLSSWRATALQSLASSIIKLQADLKTAG